MDADAFPHVHRETESDETELASRTLLPALFACVTCLLLYFGIRKSGTALDTAPSSPPDCVASSVAHPFDMSAAAPIVLNPSGRATACVILAHGLGDSGHGWSFVQDMLGRPSWIKFILPHAPMQPVTVNNGMKMPSWYDIAELGTDSSENRAQDEAGMLKSVGTISALVSKEIDGGIPANRIVLAGFSQGSVISLLTGLTTERKMAGVAVLSGYLPLHGKIASMLTDHARSTPLFWGHGDADPVVPYSWAQKSWKMLDEKLKMKDTTLKTYRGMGHSANQDEMDDLKAFLLRVIPEE